MPCQRRDPRAKGKLKREEQSVDKDFAQTANDVIAGVGLIRQGAPDAMKAFGSLSLGNCC